MPLKLYDLAAAEAERRFSPMCWRTKMSLRHKNLEVEELPWRFTEKDQIAFSGQGLVPVLVDGDKTICDSWEIARYLDNAYPDRPSLLGGAVGEAEALFIKFWCEQTIHPIVFRIVVLDVFEHIHEDDKPYFRQSREKRFRMPLEELAQPTEEQVKALQTALNPVRSTLAHQTYLGGEQPCFADYILFGPFQFARSTSPMVLLSPSDPVYAWRDRLLDAFDGYARNAPGYPV
ncbi:MAG: glutathione S-transferase family protein [Elainellaceae cyanobacterium]